LRCDGRKVGSFEADITGRIEFKRTPSHAKPQRFELLIQSAISCEAEGH